MLLKLNFVLFQTLCFLAVNLATANSTHVDVKINVDLSATFQTFEGFGSFSGDPYAFYEHKEKEKFLDILYGPNGLQLSVIRSWIQANITDFSRLKDRHEIWIQQQAKQKYGVNRFIASTWSPPYAWKSRKGESTGKNFNYLKAEHYADFANYMTDFAEEHRKLGLELYAISPQNEPEYGTTDWDGCIWLPHQTAKFVKNYLKPTLLKRNFTTKVIIGENANWNVANGYLVTTSLFLKDNDFDIYASHGYSFPQFPQFKTVTYNQKVFTWLSAALYKKERWVTEASATDKYDPTIKKAIEMANSITKFLVNGNLNGYIFWYSVINVKKNEGLIIVDGHENYTIPKVYDVYGQFTRHIKQGNVRVKATTKSSDINVVIFKDDKEKSFSAVVTNLSQKSLNVQLSFKKESIASPSATITNESKKWDPLQVSMNDDKKIVVSMTPMSVVTVVGSFK